MSRNGSGFYSLPSIYLATTGQTITAIQHNTPLTDIAADLNAARPITAGGTGATTASTARDNLGVTIGVDVQAFSTKLTTISSLTPSANALIIGSGTVWTTFTITDFAKTLLDDADAAAMRTTLGVDEAITITAGNGLTGGGDTSADMTIAVGAGNGISVTSDAVGVDSTVWRDGNPPSASDLLDASIVVAPTSSSAYSVGCVILARWEPGAGGFNNGATTSGSNLNPLGGISDSGVPQVVTSGASNVTLSGTWLNISGRRIGPDPGDLDWGWVKRTA